MLSAISAGKIDGRTQNVRYRQTQFHRLYDSIVRHLADLEEAIAADSDHTAGEVQAEIFLALHEIRTHYASLDLPASLEREYRVARGKDNGDARRGFGIVYIVPSQYTLFYSAVAAMSAALAAGNCIVLELPVSPSCSSPLLRKILSVLDSDTFAIVQDRPDADFLRNTLVVAQTALDGPLSENSIASSPGCVAAIVDRTGSVEKSAEELVVARLAFHGRSPYAPDVILVNEFCLQAFLESVIQQTAKTVGRMKASERDDRQDDPQENLPGQIIVSGTGWAVVLVKDRDSLLRRKITRRLVAVHSVSSLDDAIIFCNERSISATYTFASPAAAKYVSESIDAPAWINHVPYNMLVGPVVDQIQSTRYSASWFEIPRPQIVTRSRTAGQIRALLGSAVMPLVESLPAIDQRPGYRVGFFEQGIITGVCSLVFVSCSLLGMRILATRQTR
ncbi:hypothetical protein ASPZODRAFT_159248 [Penicilliopsis zonata CBS 506.65]|uniref:Aldehyde dehydrogenase domain-containing protein n=1 Tax=Penicilliopsis zonata CBS 506.65 TaxID=1073090 RepID=A0A1L9SJI7_9EURO|nr:hypothetical protein ASPZODRAFT_159248 [Penicilliopsis zonata CBS 506.65]OJJ47358.1 hypothetical protein ASPZODRAFT_159248 [Penicilliopsis zonata CBS 506.65]